MRSIAIIVHNVRSCHNVGSILRSADGLGADVYLTGYTPYPLMPGDTRLPHIARKTHNQISKTALGAEKSARWQHQQDISGVIETLRKAGYTITALEQTPKSVSLPDFKPPPKLAIIVGREVEGIESEILASIDRVIEIPMSGKKESFNVSIAAAVALYHAKFAFPDQNG